MVWRFEVNDAARREANPRDAERDWTSPSGQFAALLPSGNRTLDGCGLAFRQPTSALLLWRHASARKHCSAGDFQRLGRLFLSLNALMSHVEGLHSASVLSEPSPGCQPRKHASIPSIRRSRVPFVHNRFGRSSHRFACPPYGQCHEDLSSIFEREVSNSDVPGRPHLVHAAFC